MLFKNIVAGLWLTLESFTTCSQTLKSTIPNDSLNLLKKVETASQNFHLSEDEQEAFRNLYQEYLVKQQPAFKCSYLILNNLARAAAAIHDAEAFECLNSLMVYRDNNIRLKLFYFEKIFNDINGNVDLEFLQLEERREMFELSSLYQNVLLVDRQHIFASASGEKMQISADPVSGALATKFSESFVRFERENRN